MKSIVRATFPKRLKGLRAEKGVYQEQLAKEINIGRASISNYENGARIPDAAVTAALADYFDVSTDYLLGISTSRDHGNPNGERDEQYDSNLKTGITDPSAKQIIEALKICSVETPQDEYLCKKCYIYPFSTGGRMSTGRTCFEHLTQDATAILQKAVPVAPMPIPEDDFMVVQCPNCQHDIMGGIDAEEEPSYCWMCGQTLNWEAFNGQ